MMLVLLIINIYINNVKNFLFPYQVIAVNQPELPKIIISELYPQPTTEEKEWIELYNPNEEPIDISNWKLVEHFSKVEDLFIFDNLTIQPGSFYVLELPTNKLNNLEEKISLYDNNSNLIDEFSYSTSQSQQSFSKEITQDSIIIENIHMSVPTKMEFNIITSTNNTQETEENTIASSEENTEKVIEKNMEMDDIETKKVVEIERNNQKLETYQSMTGDLQKTPNIKKVRSKNIKPKEDKFSYLVQKHVSKEGIQSAIIGGLLLIFVGFLL